MDFMRIAENMYLGINFFYDLTGIHAPGRATARAGTVGCKGMVVAGKSPQKPSSIKNSGPAVSGPAAGERKKNGPHGRSPEMLFF